MFGEGIDECVRRVSEKRMEDNGSQLHLPQGLLGQEAPPLAYPVEPKVKSQRLQG